MKKASVFISTAALMAGTACGVWAETNDTTASSFDRVERSVYDSNVNHRPDMAAAVGIEYAGSTVASEGTGTVPRSGSVAEGVYSPMDNAVGNASNTNNNATNNGSGDTNADDEPAGASNSMGSLTPDGTGTNGGNTGRSMMGGGSTGGGSSSGSGGGGAGGAAGGGGGMGN